MLNIFNVKKGDICAYGYDDESKLLVRFLEICDNSCFFSGEILYFDSNLFKEYSVGQLVKDFYCSSFRPFVK